MAGLTQRGPEVALRVDERQIRFWERRTPKNPRKVSVSSRRCWKMVWRYLRSQQQGQGCCNSYQFTSTDWNELVRVV